MYINLGSWHLSLISLEKSDILLDMGLGNRQRTGLDLGPSGGLRTGSRQYFLIN